MGLGLLSAKGAKVCLETKRAIKRGRAKKDSKLQSARTAAWYFAQDTEKMFEILTCQGIKKETMPMLKESLHRLYVLDEMMNLAKVNYSPVRDIYMDMVESLNSIKFPEDEPFQLNWANIRKTAAEVAGFDH